MSDKDVSDAVSKALERKEYIRYIEDDGSVSFYRITSFSHIAYLPKGELVLFVKADDQDHMILLKNATFISLKGMVEEWSQLQQLPKFVSVPRVSDERS